MPGAVTVTGGGDAVEGTNPSSGTLTVGGGNINPRGISGVVDLSRELADTASPAADQVILTALRESYTAQAEAHIAAELGTLTPVGTTAAANLARDVNARSPPWSAAGAAAPQPRSSVPPTRSPTPPLTASTR